MVVLSLFFMQQRYICALDLISSGHSHVICLLMKSGKMLANCYRIVLKNICATQVGTVYDIKDTGCQTQNVYLGSCVSTTFEHQF